MDGWADITDSTLFKYNWKKKKKKEKWKKVNEIKFSSVGKQTKMVISE